MKTTLKTQSPPNQPAPAADGSAAPLSPDLLRKIDAYWRTANFPDRPEAGQPMSRTAT